MPPGKLTVEAIGDSLSVGEWGSALVHPAPLPMTFAQALHPPSTAMVVPVMNRPLSPARWTTVAAMSSAVP